MIVSKYNATSRINVFPRSPAWALLFFLCCLAGCSDDSDTPPEPEQQVGFEILEVQSPTSIRAWISRDITREEFDALELPEGWIKNQPREGGANVDGPDDGRFLRSPDSAEDGEFLQDELFGFNWFHAATVVQTPRPLDQDGLLQASTVRKFHELTYNAGSTLVLLVSPLGEVYFRIGRDADRVSDEPAIPNLWQLVEYTATETLVFELFEQNTVIRTDNQDAFQGPVVIEDLITSGLVPDPNDLTPLPLSRELCEDPENMTLLMDSPLWAVLSESDGLNNEQVQRMVAAPTEGPFYMLNLIRYREKALYADGRETDLTGREANALYSPIEYLDAIGAGPVFLAGVDNQIDGDDPLWEEVALVEYPCPVAFFTMITNPDFRARLIHKDAGVEETFVMVTHLEPSSVPSDFEFPDPLFPATEDDPAFELIHVMDFHEVAQYEAGADEPERSGSEAWAEYQAAGSEATLAIGSRLTARFTVQGVLTGDERSWDAAYIVHMPSMAGFQALLDDPDRQAASYHRTAALSSNYSMITTPVVNTIDAGDGPVDLQLLPVTDTGVGTICLSDADCVGIGFCLSDGNGPGFCSRGCGSGECGEPYLCCYDCSELAAAALPFSESACMLDQFAQQLTSAPVSCTCD